MSIRLRMIRAIHLGVLMLACIIQAQAAEVFEAKMGAALQLDGQDGWSYMTGGDAGDGAYMLYTPGVAYPATVTLSSSIAAGQYYAFVKALRYFTSSDPTYRTNDPIRIECGGGLVEKYPNDADYNLRWTGPFPVTVGSETDEVVISFLVKAPSALQKVMILGMAFTDNPNYIVTKNDEFLAMGETYPSASMLLPIPGNLVPNSGFECGIGQGWSLDSTTRDFSLQSLWSSSGHESDRSIKLPTAYLNGLLSRVYRVSPNKQHTLSVWAKAAEENTSAPTLRLLIENTYTPPEGFAARCMASNNFTVPMDSQWHRYSVSGTLYKYPAENYQLRIVSPAGRGIYIDDVQFEEGALTDYNPQKWSLCVSNNAIGGIFYSNAAASVSLVVANQSGADASPVIKLSVLDSNNALAHSQQITQAVSSGVISSVPVTLPSLACGHYRLIAVISGMDFTREETVFSVITEPHVSGFTKGGVHPNCTSDALDFMRRLGVTWSRTLSPAQTFRWGTIEATQGVTDYSKPDAHVPLYQAAGMNVMGVLGDESNPSWARTIAATNFDVWLGYYLNYVTNVVERYKDDVTCWEIHNEPNASPELGSSPSNYAKLLKEATDCIRAIDPDATIVAMGGTGFIYASNVVYTLENTYSAWGWTNHISAVSTHLYPGNEAESSKYWDYFITDRGMPVWNTETGSWSDGFHTSANSGYRREGQVVSPNRLSARFYNMQDDVRAVLYNVLTCLGYGFSRYFYYDSRLWHSQLPGTHPTIRDYDDSCKPQGVALMQAFNILDASTNAEPVTLSDGNIKCFLFAQESGAGVAALWRTGSAVSVSLEDSVTVLDLMGNYLCNTNELRVDVNPRYVIADDSSELFQWLTNATVSTSADVIAPKAIVADWSPAAASQSELWVRFLGLDDFDFPNDSNPDAVQYSYKLEGVDSDWSDWTSDTLVTYGSPPSGSYTFYVKAKDLSGNISETVSDVILWNNPTQQPPQFLWRWK